jgi:hypothetical protein
MLVPFQTTATDLTNYAYVILYAASFLIVFVYQAKIQIYIAMRKVGGSLRKLEGMK